MWLNYVVFDDVGCVGCVCLCLVVLCCVPCYLRGKAIAATRNPALGLFGLLNRDVEISFTRTFGAAASGHNGACPRSRGGK